MSDEDLITQAHEEFIKNLFKNFCDAHTSSTSSIEAEGKQIFQNAVKPAARNTRDRALAILPNENPLIHSKFMQTLLKPLSIVNKKE